MSLLLCIYIYIYIYIFSSDISSIFLYLLTLAYILLQSILTRRNSITGIEYRNDPTIFAWELINEPHCMSDASGDTLQVSPKFLTLLLFTPNKEEYIKLRKTWLTPDYRRLCNHDLELSIFIINIGIPNFNSF
jgi:hypothetical protein